VNAIKGISVLSVCLASASFLCAQNKPTEYSSSKSSSKTEVPSKAVSSEQVVPAIPVDESYKVGAGDELNISVWHENDLSGPVVVRPDGMITMPLLNDINVTGLTMKQLTDSLTEKLKAFLTEPQVTVTVRSIRSRKVYLVGNISKQGSYPLNDRMTVLQIIAEAGGLTPFAKSEKIYVIRNSDGKQQRLEFHYKRALKGNSADDIALLPGDMVIIP
jgi:polysaccharide biosynthesis/export protein